MAGRSSDKSGSSDDEPDSNLKIKRGINGLGVFAAKRFRKGERIHALDGKKMPSSQLPADNRRFKNGMVDPLQVGVCAYMNLNRLSRTFNHSCEPNAGIRGRSTLFALRDIMPGEEITYDYSTTIDESFWCRCGSKKCRGVIYDFFALPAADRKNYHKKRALPAFIMRKMNRLQNSPCPCGSGKKYRNCHGAR